MHKKSTGPIPENMYKQTNNKNSCIFKIKENVCNTITDEEKNYSFLM